MGVELVTTIAAAAILAAFAWLWIRAKRQDRADREYDAQVTGSRSGTIKIAVDGRKVNSEFEMGKSVDFIIYRSSLTWENGSPLKQDEVENFRSAVDAWCRSRGSSFEFADDT